MLPVGGGAPSSPRPNGLAESSFVDPPTGFPLRARRFSVEVCFISGQWVSRYRLGRPSWNSVLIRPRVSSSRRISRTCVIPLPTSWARVSTLGKQLSLSRAKCFNPIKTRKPRSDSYPSTAVTGRLRYPGGGITIWPGFKRDSIPGGGSPTSSPQTGSPSPMSASMRTRSHLLAELDIVSDS